MTRRRIMLAVNAVALASLATALSAGELAAQQKRESVLVPRVISVSCTLEKSNPPNALVQAVGEVTTGGYRHPRLVRLIYVMPPIDGIQDLDFYVDPPKKGGATTQAIRRLKTPILRIRSIPSWMRGVRVRGETNRVEIPCS